MSSLWAAIDSYLATELLAALGSAGNYDDIVVASVLVDRVWDVDAVQRRDEYPLVLVSSGVVAHATDKHSFGGGGGAVSMGNIYDYDLFASCLINAMDSPNAKQEAMVQAQELHRRLLRFLRTRHALGGLASTSSADGDVERVQQVIYRNSGFTVTGVANENSGDYYGVAVVSLQIKSEAT